MNVLIPLHLKPWDDSKEASQARVNHQVKMRLLNPKGFRVFSNKKGRAKPYHLSTLAFLAQHGQTREQQAQQQEQV